MKRLVIFALFAALALAHTCIHEQMQAKHQIHSINEDIDERSMVGIGDVQAQSIRIHFDVSSLANLDAKNKDLLINRLIPYAKLFFEKRLKVRRSTNPVKFPDYYKNCVEVSIPSAHKTTGVDTDLLIYATAENAPSQSFLAWASTCLRDSSINGRPVAGQINFNLAYMSSELNKFEPQVDTILHEITHILAFSPGHYDNFVDAKGNKRGGSNVYEKITWRETPTNIIKTPKILSFAKDHYKCDNIKGMELENQGGSGSLGAHWERTILHNEGMTASDIKDASYSKFTMGILEDSGWYVPNYDLAEPFFFGQGKGCDFLNKGCNGTSFREFCTTQRTACTFDYSAKGYCAQDSFSDSCKYVKGYSNAYCSDTTNQPQSYYGEKVGPKSKCLMTTLLLTNYGNQNTAQPGCFEYSCDADHTQVTVTAANGNSGVCTSSGQKVTISGYTGSVTCPNIKEFCLTYYPSCPNYCSAHGYCFKGKCECKPGHGGADCSIETTCPNGCSGNGKCNDDSTCTCNTGFFGKDCSQFTCTDSCGANGVCSGPNKCTCKSGYTGATCTQFTCIVNKNCNGNGNCVGPNQCQCNSGWTGNDCATPVCTNNCSGNGKCTAPNTCQCNTGYGESDCSKILNGGASCTTQADCNGRGFCHNSKCLCYDGFSNSDCSIATKKCLNDCTNRDQGFCSHRISYSSRDLTSKTTAVCNCMSGWTGDDCSQKAAANPNCPNNCFYPSKGICWDNSCYCWSGNSGKDCSIAA